MARSQNLFVYIFLWLSMAITDFAMYMCILYFPHLFILMFDVDLGLQIVIIRNNQTKLINLIYNKVQSFIKVKFR